MARSDSCIKLNLRALRVDWRILKKILRIGVPSAVQMAITSFSNVFVQSYINYFGADCMSGWTAYGKIDQLILLPMQSIALATTTFVGQNLGAGLEPRARKGASKALLISVTVTAVAMIPVMVFAPSLTAFFNAKPEVVEYGTLFLRWITPAYLLCCVNQIYSGVLRGAGNSRIPMFVMLCSFVVFRQIYLFVVANFISNTILPIAMGYPAGWIVCSALTLWYYKRTKLTATTVVDSKE
jgi:Na+-driven multidrug efflux pump